MCYKKDFDLAVANNYVEKMSRNLRAYHTAVAVQDARATELVDVDAVFDFKTQKL